MPSLKEVTLVEGVSKVSIVQLKEVKTGELMDVEKGVKVGKSLSARGIVRYIMDSSEQILNQALRIHIDIYLAQHKWPVNFIHRAIVSVDPRALGLFVAPIVMPWELKKQINLRALLNEELSVYGTIAFVHFGNAAVVAAYFSDSMVSTSFLVLIASLMTSS